MKRWVSTVGLSLLVASLPVSAQQANQNINVLPVPENVDSENQEAAALTGDLYLQRQVEPTIAVSTRNPDHLIAFFNDYRAVDVPDDPGLGETQNVAEKKGVLDRFLAWFRGRPEPVVEARAPEQVAAAEAWVGGSRSYDGGITWSGFFVPGAPFDDDAQATLDSPVFGLEAATDPVAAAAPCGRVEVVWLAFTRGGQSKMVVSTYEDLNNDEGGDTWKYLRSDVLETGNNALNGYFLDKPFLIVDPKREEGAGCGYNVYASYTTFNGQESDGKFRSKVTFARSIDSGASYSTQKLNAPFHQNQGTWIAVDPRAGTPNSTGGGTIHLFWRHFFDPDTILTIDSTNYGATFPGNPKKLTGNENIAAFDQPSLGIGAVAHPVTDLTFRSNGFPTATVTPEGVILVAWQEKVEITDPESETFGQPSTDTLSSPRIVMMRSTNGGQSWEGFDPDPLPDPQSGADAPRQAIDFGSRDQPGSSSLPPDGFGALPQARPSGPQVMPALSCGGDRCMLTYYESRGVLSPLVADTIDAIDLSETGFISGLDRLLDLRATLLDPLTGVRLSTTQVSRYPVSAGASLVGGETLDDIDEVCSPYLPPPEGPGGVLCRRRINAFGKPQSAAGTTPFGGDYTFVTPILSLVPDLEDTAPGDWRWATEAADVPYRSFHAIWADNRNLAAPTVPGDVAEAYRYSSYGPPNIGGACFNAGSRNTDVLTARVDAELIVTAPTTYKQQGARRGFPLSVSNGTDVTRYYRLAIVEPIAGENLASFALDEALDVDEGDVEIFRYSSIAQVVYVDPDAAAPIQVTVTEIGGCSNSSNPPCQTGSVTFNADTNQTPVVGLETESQEPSASNPFVINKSLSNPFVINESLSNPFVINPFVINPFVINTAPGEPEYDEIQGIVDTTWTVSASESSTASSYLSLINIDNAEQYFDDYIFQLITYRTSGNGGFGAGTDPCASYNIPQDQIISSVYNDPANPFVINPFVINPFVINPFVINPFVINSTFTMAPSDGTSSSPIGESRTLALDDGTTKAPRRPDEVRVTLRAYQISASPAVAFRPAIDPPSYSVVSLPCDPAVSTDCIFSTAPDLLPALNSGALSSGTVTVGQTIDFPANGWVLRNLGVTDATADESETLRHGFYLSSFNPDGWLAANPGRTTADMIAEPGFRSMGVYETSDSPSLGSGLTEPFGSSSLTIPTDLAGGVYYLVLFVDDLLEVSESNEVNNFELASFSIIVEVNTAPVAVDDSFDIDEDTPYTGTLAANDDEGDDLTFVLADPFAVKGEVDLDTDTGDFTYTPNLDENGSDTFGFTASDGEFDSNLGTVSVSITAINDPPVPTAGQTFVVPEDGSLIDTLEATDADADDVLTFAVVPGSGPANGVLVLNPDGSFVYKPNLDFAGTDSFEFTVCDQTDVCSTVSALVSVSVNATPDPPVLAPIGPQSVEEGESLSFGVSATDPDIGDTLTLTATGVPSSCSFASAGPIGSIDCSPDFTQSGTFNVTVTVADSGSPRLTDAETFVLTVVEVNRDPVLAPIGSQTVDEGGSLSIPLSATDPDLGDDLALGVGGLPEFCIFDSPDSGQGSISCSPDFTVAGSYSMTVTVTDNGAPNLTDSETFPVDVSNVPRAPVALDDAFDVNQNGSVTFDPILNPAGLDFDPDGDSISLVDVTVVDPPPLNGPKVSLDGDEVTYVPGLNFLGLDTLTYTITDGSLQSTGTIRITVLDGVLDWTFVGLQSPWKVNPTPRVNLGSAFPVRWQYADPSTGEVVDSADSVPEVRIRGPYATCNSVGNGDALEVVLFPGNSGYQYDDRQFLHQLNWDTMDAVKGACYSIRVYSGKTWQINYQTDDEEQFLVKIK